MSYKLRYTQPDGAIHEWTTAYTSAHHVADWLCKDGGGTCTVLRSDGDDWREMGTYPKELTWPMWP